MVFAMFSLLGGHWGVLRSVAWTTMIVERSASVPLMEAVSSTFSGKSPCKMCTVIAEKSSQEKSTPAGLKLDKKVDPFGLVALSKLPRVKSSDHGYPRCNAEHALGFSQKPPTPVPIRIA
jgi:hypothetical protein